MDKKYLVNIEGNKIEVGYPDFYERNQGLAIAYKSEPDAETRGSIAAKLAEMCNPVFRSWEIFDDDDRKDFEQDCYLLTVMALDSFNEKKGSFVSWLKRYAKNARTNYKDSKRVETVDPNYTAEESAALKGTWGYRKNIKDINKVNGVKSRVNDEGVFRFANNDEADEDTKIDFGRIQNLVSPSRFELLRMRIIERMSKVEIAKRLDLSVPTVSKRIAKAYEAVRLGMVLSGGNNFESSTGEDGSVWLTAHKLSFRLDIPRAQLYKMSHEGYKTKYMINPDHILKFGAELRYRFKVNSHGVEYPELRLRNSKPHSLSKEARKERANGK